MKRSKTTYVDLRDTYGETALATLNPDLDDYIDCNRNISLMHPDFMLLGVF